MTALGERYLFGHISSVQLHDGTWLSWTLWTQGDHRKHAEEHATNLLAGHPDRYTAARVIRVEHTIVATHAPGRSSGLFEAFGEWEGGHLPQSEKG